MGDRPQTPFGSAPFLPLWGSPPFTLLPWPSSSSSSSLLAHHLQIGPWVQRGVGPSPTSFLARRPRALAASAPLGPARPLGDASSTSLGWAGWRGAGPFCPAKVAGGASFVPSEELGQVPGPGPAGAWGVLGGGGRRRQEQAGRQAGHCWQSASAAGAGGKEGCPCCAGQFPGQGAGRSRPGPAGQSAVGAVSGDGGLRRARCRPSCCGSRWPAWRHSSGRR